MPSPAELAPGAWRALAPAKVNLGLFVGPRRASDGRHELVSVMQSISLADELVLETAAVAGEDQLVCAQVPGAAAENLAMRALRAFREATGWDAPALRLRIRKRIPLAAGLGGGSADAAATLRLAAGASGLGDEALLRAIGGELGADVPAQIEPGRWLAGGAGERLRQLPDPDPPLALLVIPSQAQLSTARVYAEADRLGLGSGAHELQSRSRALWGALREGAPLPADPGLLHNDLQAAALALCPAIADALRAAREAGARHAFVSGSGPTVVGLLVSDDAPGQRSSGVPASARGLLQARSVTRSFAQPRPLSPRGAPAPRAR